MRCGQRFFLTFFRLCTLANRMHQKTQRLYTVELLRFIPGALTGRYAWIAAGRVSSNDP
jgi:hypothetical protein